MYPVFVGPRVRAIAMDVMTPTTALRMFSTLYQPVFFAMVFVFDMQRRYRSLASAAETAVSRRESMLKEAPNAFSDESRRDPNPVPAAPFSRPLRLTNRGPETPPFSGESPRRSCLPFCCKPFPGDIALKRCLVRS